MMTAVGLVVIARRHVARTVMPFFTVIFAGIIAFSGRAGTPVETYWPLNNGDIEYFSGTGGSAYVQVNADTADTPSQFELAAYTSPSSSPTSYSPDSSMNIGYSAAGDALFNYSQSAQGYTVYITPAWQLLNDKLLTAGGKVKSSFTGTIPGVASVQFTATVTVQSVGTVTVPAGTYHNCKELNLNLSGGKVHASAQAYILAPKVGLIKVAMLDSNTLKVIGWQSLTGGTIGGVDVRNLTDSTPPTITITSPARNAQVTNATVNLNGTARDDVQVAAVYYQLNGGNWSMAAGTTNWTVTPLQLALGTNTVRVYAVDSSGNDSTTNSVGVFYDVNAPLIVRRVGTGSVTPDLNGQSLPIGRSFTMTAKAASGFAFWYWSGSIQKTNPTLTFLMASNLDFTANFVDVTRPVNIVSYPAVNQLITNATITATGKAKDNVGVETVWYQFNGAEWTNGLTSNSFTNWTTSALTLSKGTNVIAAFAVDAAGNASLTNTVKFRH